LWIGTPTWGVIKFDGITFTNFIMANSNIPSNFVSKTRVDVYNNKWFATQGGLAVYNENGIVGVDDLIFGIDEIIVYPNPAQNELNISLNKKDCEQIVITDVLGRVVYQTKLTKTSNSNLKINCTDFSNGLYFVNVLTEQKVLSKKVLIQK
jgi:hypothetical protein